MNEHPFQALLALVHFDQEINQLNSQITLCKQDILNLENELKATEQSLSDAKQKVHDYKKLVDEQELAMKEIGDLERDKKNRLHAASNYKEMTALQAEIVLVQEQEAQAEQQLLDLWNKLENSQKELITTEQVYLGQKAEIEASTAQKNQEITSLRNELEAKAAERQPMEVKVPEEWREKYTIMKARVTNPVVPIQGASCSACFYTITPQEVVRLKRRALLQCHGCFRLLYSQEAMQQPDTDPENTKSE